jgi:hypothetical protein
VIVTAALVALMGWPVELCVFSRVVARLPRPAIGWPPVPPAD